VFRRKNPHAPAARRLYLRVAEAARRPELFERFGVPDTLDGRFDALALHVWMAIDRLRAEPDGADRAQALFDAVMAHLDLTLREIGVQDLGVGRRIKVMADGLHGRSLAYRAALAGDGPEPFRETLRRNGYGGTPPALNDAGLAAYEAYVRSRVAELGEMDANALPEKF